MLIIVQYLQDRLIFDSRKNGDFRILSNTVLQIWCYFIMLDMYLFFLFFFLPLFFYFSFSSLELLRHFNRKYIVTFNHLRC